MLIAITGASGFIATSISKKMKIEDVNYVFLKRDETDAEWQKKLIAPEVIINLAGAPVIQRWNKKNRKKIFGSRVTTTKRIVKLLNTMPEDIQPKLLISASAIGIYPDKGDEVHNEYSQHIGHSFLSEVVLQWEKEALNLTHPKIRLVIPRIGVVLGKDGGLLKKTLPIFKLGLGGKIASGKQALSFIHIDDLVGAFKFFIENNKTKGVYNLVVPSMATNNEFTRTMGRILKRPTMIPVPAFALKLIYGQASRIMINGEKVYPAKLISEGFKFNYPGIQDVLQALLMKS